MRASRSKGLTVARVDAENNLLMIRGAVPGANGSVVIVKKAQRRESEVKSIATRSTVGVKSNGVRNYANS